jgi:uncharacterized damage-inducible protein DinB
MYQLINDYLKLLAKLHADFEKCLEGMTVEGLDWTPGRDMNSLCVLVVHVVGSARYWVGDVAAGIDSKRNRDAEFQARSLDAAQLKAFLIANREFIQSVLEKLTPDDLVISRFGHQETAGEAILHALEHTALHVGHAQLTRQLWDQRQS